MHHAGRPGDRRHHRDRDRTDDAADDGRNFLQVHQLARLVHRHRALALGIAQVKGEFAACDALRTCGSIELVERQLHRFAGRLAKTPGGAGEGHHHTRRMGTRGRLRRSREGSQCSQGCQSGGRQQEAHICQSPVGLKSQVENQDLLRSYFMMRPCGPVLSRSRV